MTSDTSPFRPAYYGLCAAFVCAVYALRLACIGSIPLLGAEAYYWEWAQHPAWGYFDHPPMIAWIIYGFTALGGDSAFFVRIGAVVLSILTTLAAYGIVRDMFGTATAVAAGCILQILPFFAAVSVVSVPDAPLAFFWVLTVYCLYRATCRQQPAFWYAAGVALGLGFLSKYHTFLMIPCAGLYLVCSRELRVWLSRKEPYIALGLALLIFLPNLYWNAARGLTTFSYLLAGRHGSLHFSPTGLAVFAGGMLIFMSPLLAVLVIRLLPRMVRQAVPSGDKRYLLLLATSLPPIVFFGLLSPVIDVGMHWPAVGYPTLCLAAIAVLMEQPTPRGRALFRGFPAASIACALALVLTAYGVPLALSIQETPRHIRIGSRTYVLDISELRGWDELGPQLLRETESMPDPRRTFLITHAYRLASQLRFLTHSGSITGITGHKSPHQYSLWDPLQSCTGWDALFVDKEQDEKDIRILQGLFSRVGPIEALEIKKGTATIRTFYIIRCYGYKAGNAAHIRDTTSAQVGNPAGAERRGAA